MSNSKRQPAGIPIGGQFAANEHDEAGGELGSAGAAFDLEAEAYSLEIEYEKALRAETAAHFGLAAEQYGEDGAVVLEFDDQDGDVTIWSPDGEQLEEDSLIDLIPEGIRNGKAEVSYENGVYTVDFVNFDEGADQQFSIATPRSTNGIVARDTTTRRALLRDAAEQVAVSTAFESASSLTGKDEITFYPNTAEVDGSTVNTLRLDGTSIAVSPPNARASDAFGFYGRGVKSVTVRRDGGGYVIERTVTTPISNQEEVLINRVEKESYDLWESGSL